MKPAWQSKTLWLNVITSLLAVATVLAGSEWVAANPKLVAGFGVAISVLNIALRFVTTEGISLK